MFEPVRLRQAVPQPVAATAGRPANRSIENLVIALFWLLLLEGVLRKWVAPQFAQYLFFIRDPVVLLLYWQAWRANAFRDSGLLLQVGLVFAFAAVFLAFVQSIAFGNPRMFAVAVYGWRQYFLYLPLPFAMAATLNQDSLYRFARHVFVAVLLVAPLVVIQSVSPPSAVINRGIAEDEALQFQSFAFTGGGIRPSGPFTSTVGVKELIPATFALLLAVWLMPRTERKIGSTLLLLAAGATATCLAVSGSRAAFLHLFIVALAAFLVGMVSRLPSVRLRAIGMPVALLTAGAVLYPLVFPDALAAMLQRVAEANAAETRVSSLGIFGRAFADAFGFAGYLQNTPLAGFGLGMGGNGRAYLGTQDAALLARVYAESDWSRHIVDLGVVVGLLFIVFRIAFTGSVFLQSLRASRLSGNPFPLMLFGYVGIGLFYGQLTGHGTVGGFLWLFLGLCMASCRDVERRP